MYQGNEFFGLHSHYVFGSAPDLFFMMAYGFFRLFLVFFLEDEMFSYQNILH